MKSFFAVGLAALITCWAGFASAGTAISVNAWARASIPGTNTGAVYGTITNNGDAPVTLSAIRTTVANSAMLHETVMKNGMASMHHLVGVTIAPGETFTCAPGARHIMLMGMKRQLAEGDHFEITLEFEGGKSVTADVKVGTIGQMTAPR